VNSEENRVELVGIARRGALFDPPILVAALLAAYLATMLGLVLGLTDNQLAHFFHDDAFFYIKTAQNLADGYGSTFDRFSRTNGYHPLWLLTLTSVAALRPLIGFGGLRWVMFIHAILVAGACYQLCRFVRRLGGSPTVQGVGIAATLAASGASDIGLESALLLLVAWTYLSLLAKAILASRVSAGMAAGIAVFAALATLARTDAVLLIEAVSLLVWLENRRRPRTALLAAALPSLAALVAFFAFCGFNQIHFGHPDTISSHLKVGWPGTFATDWLPGSLLGTKVRMICCAFIAVLTLAHSSTAKRDQHRSLCIGIALFTLSYVTILVLFARGGVGSWYFALPLSLSLLRLTFACRLGATRRRRPSAQPLLSRRSLHPLGLLLLRLSGAAPLGYPQTAAGTARTVAQGEHWRGPRGLPGRRDRIRWVSQRAKRD
jgi:hypothetical protein